MEGFGFRYHGSPRRAVADFGMEVEEGEVAVLAGPSGCGKSTLLRAVNGLIPHMYAGDYEGEVTVDGLRVKDTPMRDLAQKVGFLFQNPENQIFMFSVERDVAFGLENLGMERRAMRERVDEAMKMLGVTELAKRAPHELSDGQKQRVALAGVMAMRPRLVILDEPTSLLDPMTAAELVSLVERLRKEEGITFIIVEHRLELLVRIADRLIVMDEGRKILDGSPEEVLRDVRAEEHGVAVPASVALENYLRSQGMTFRGSMLPPEELASEVNSKA